jgi:hypothetical protein
MIFDIDNGKVDPVWEANRGGSGFCLEIYELKKRAVWASELIRKAKRQFLLTDAEKEDKRLRRDRCHRKQADQFVWKHIQPLPAEKFGFKKEGAHVIDSWRRRLRALAQGNSIQGWWADRESEGDFPLPVATPLWHEVQGVRDLGYGAEQIALRLLSPFSTYSRRTSPASRKLTPPG